MKINPNSKPKLTNKRYRHLGFTDPYKYQMYSDSSDDYIDKLKAKASRYKNDIRP